MNRYTWFTEAQLRSGSGDKGALVEAAGPGNYWRRVVTWHIPASAAVGSALYQLDVQFDGSVDLLSR
jgi:ABC-2 type transport system permease protein